MQKIRFIILLCFYPALFYAQQVPIYINSGDTMFSMVKMTTFKEDKTWKQGLTEILNDTTFAPMTKEVFRIGGTNPRNIWVKFQVKKSIAADIYFELMTGITDSIYLYSVSPHNEVTEQRIGAYFAFNERVIKNNHQIFILNGSKDELCTYYINIRSIYPLSIGARIGTSLAFSEEYHLGDLLHGILIGIIIIIALFNLLFFISLRNWFYTYYVGYIFFIMCTILRYDCYMNQFLYPSFPHFNDIGFYYHGLAGIFGIYFSRNFLKTKIYTPRLDKGLVFFLGFYIFNVLTALLGFYELNIWSVYLMTFPFNLFLIYTGVQVYRKGYLVARFFVAGIFCSTVGITIFTFYNMGFLKSNLWISNIMYMGIGIESILLFLAIIERFSVLRQEKQVVQEKMIESLQQNEHLLKEKQKLLEENASNKARQIEFMESQLSEYAQKLIKSNQELTDFAHIASHDLKAPLRNIGSFTQLLQKRISSHLDERSKEYFVFIMSNVRQSTQFIEDLLNYSKIDKNIGEPTDVALDDILLLVKSNLQSFISEKKAHIIVEDLPILRGHSSLIVQLFQNLINNGLKYNEHQMPTVTITCDKQNNDIIFKVADNGIGIAPQYKNQVFGMFRRLHSSAQYEGSGIGLAFCQRIVSTYNGRIWLESEEGKGTTFYFTLPDAIEKEMQNIENGSTIMPIQSGYLYSSNENENEISNFKGENVFSRHAQSKSYINSSTTKPVTIQFDSRKATHHRVLSEQHTAPYSENATRFDSVDLEKLSIETKEEGFSNDQPPSSS